VAFYVRFSMLGYRCASGLMGFREYPTEGAYVAVGKCAILNLFMMQCGTTHQM